MQRKQFFHLVVYRARDIIRGMDIQPTCFLPPEYHTRPETVPPYRLRYLLGNSLAFYLQIVRIGLAGRRFAARGEFDGHALTHLSVLTAQAVERCGGIIHVTGLDHLYATPGAAVVVGNHMSTLETWLLPSMIQPVKPLAFVVKESLLTHPFFGKIMRAQPCIAVTRRNPREDLKTVLEKGTDMLKSGRSLCIFPQATRQFEFIEDEFNSLGVKLARRAGVPVIPVAQRTDFWGNGKWLKEIGPIGRNKVIRVAFGAPAPATATPQEIHAHTLEFVRRHLQVWGVPCLATRPGAEPVSGKSEARNSKSETSNS